LENRRVICKVDLIRSIDLTYYLAAERDENCCSILIEISIISELTHALLQPQPYLLFLLTTGIICFCK
jgi:hypothetical protein